mgnify:CR=1 FL=1
MGHIHTNPDYFLVLQMSTASPETCKNSMQKKKKKIKKKTKKQTNPKQTRYCSVKSAH